MPSVWHSAKTAFVECWLCRVQHSTNCLFVECPCFDTRQSAEHSAKSTPPVVNHVRLYCTTLIVAYGGECFVVSLKLGTHAAYQVPSPREKWLARATRTLTPTRPPPRQRQQASYLQTTRPAGRAPFLVPFHAALSPNQSKQVGSFRIRISSIAFAYAAARP